MHETLERSLSLSTADDCIVIGRESTSANVRWASNSTTTNGESRTRQLTVISIVQGRIGAVTLTDYPDLETVVRSSETAARTRAPAEDVMPLVEAGDTPSDWDEPAEPAGIEALGRVAPPLRDTFERADASGIKLFGYAEASTSTVWLATSSGLRRRHTSRRGSIQLNAKTPDFSESAWNGAITRDFSDVDVHALYDGLQTRLEWSKQSVMLDPGRYEVILQPPAASDMILPACRSAARDADEGRSPYAKPGGGNRIGEKLFATSVNVFSDPGEPGLEVAPFVVASGSSSGTSVFDNGLPAGRTEWITNGVLRALVTPRWWASQTGAPVTPRVDNVVMQGGNATLDDMIASSTRALLVTSFFYIRSVDARTMLLTGLTRDGVFLVEDGEVRAAVNNFRFNMSPIDLLGRTTEIGRSDPALGRETGAAPKRIPPVRVDGFHMSSVSQAT